MTFKKEITISFPMLALMGLLFLALKLSHQIDWSWAWVLAPFWVAPSLLLILIVVDWLDCAIDRLIKRKDLD